MEGLMDFSQFEDDIKCLMDETTVIIPSGDNAYSRITELEMLIACVHDTLKNQDDPMDSRLIKCLQMIEADNLFQD